MDDDAWFAFCAALAGVLLINEWWISRASTTLESDGDRRETHDVPVGENQWHADRLARWGGSPEARHINNIGFVDDSMFATVGNDNTLRFWGTADCQRPVMKDSGAGWGVHEGTLSWMSSMCNDLSFTAAGVYNNHGGFLVTVSSEFRAARRRCPSSNLGAVPKGAPSKGMHPCGLQRPLTPSPRHASTAVCECGTKGATIPPACTIPLE